LFTYIHTYHIRGTFLKLLKNYLSERKSCVSVDGFTSDLMETFIGIPQGDHLAQLLFILSRIDLLNLEMDICKLIGYADDLTMYQDKCDKPICTCHTTPTKKNTQQQKNNKNKRPKNNPITELFCSCRSADGTGWMILCKECKIWHHPKNAKTYQKPNRKHSMTPKKSGRAQNANLRPSPLPHFVKLGNTPKTPNAKSAHTVPTIFSSKKTSIK